MDINDIKERALKRLDTCKECEQYRKSTQQCKKCGCFMPAKVLVPFMSCPLYKW